jgi:porphyrinogen peroxidase
VLCPKTHPPRRKSPCEQPQRGGTTSCASRPSAGIDRAKCLISLKATGEQVLILCTVTLERAVALVSGLREPSTRRRQHPAIFLFHIRAERSDLCFEFERILLDSLGTGVTVVDEVSGFRYFDARDLLGFIDGTANPTGLDLSASALVGDEDATFAGGSYVVVQKYLHDLTAWAQIPTPIQEKIRTKIDNIEIDDDDASRKSHKSLATIVDAGGNEYDILRDNMPFGRPGHREFGTYFIGYSRYLWVIEKMLQRMYVGDPPGAYDRLLDFSTPHTGTTFFAPSRPTLQRLTQAAQEKLTSAPTRDQTSGLS